MTPLGGRPLIHHPLAAASGAGLETVIVAKPTTLLPPLGGRVLLEPEDPSHPLCGVITALELAAARTPAPAVVMLACDMPFLTSPLLAWLARLDGAAMAHVNGLAQPLLARCLAEQLPALRDALSERRSLTAAIEALRPRLLRERDLARFGRPERLCFNVNDPEDLRRAEEWL
jgi:molybdopterin-guanine dinucleotide biosynthesis protein A